MGYSMQSITMDLYAHILPDVKTKEMQKISDLFRTKNISWKKGRNMGRSELSERNDLCWEFPGAYFGDGKGLFACGEKQEQIQKWCIDTKRSL